MNNISCHAVAHIQLQVIRTDDPMVILQSKGIQQSSSNIIIISAAFDAVIKRTVIPIQDMKK